MKILVIEDEKQIRDMVALALERDGFEVTTAETMDEAAKSIRYNQWDLVISDVMLPYKGGFELVDDIKSTSPATPVILITGMSRDVLEATVTKADLVIHKPFSGKEIATQVKKLLKSKGEPAH